MICTEFLFLILAPKGLFLTHSSSATLRVTEGELVQFDFIFLLYHPGNPKPTETQFIYKRTASGGFISPNGSVVLEFGLARINDYCYLDDRLTSPTGAITPRPQPYGVRVRNPNVNDSGNYSVVVPYDGTNYTANFTIIGKISIIIICRFLRPSSLPSLSFSPLQYYLLKPPHLLPP